MLAEYFSIVRSLDVFLSKKFKCKDVADLNEFMWADDKKGVRNGDFLSDLLQTSEVSMCKRRIVGWSGGLV